MLRKYIFLFCSFWCLQTLVLWFVMVDEKVAQKHNHKWAHRDIKHKVPGNKAALRTPTHSTFFSLLHVRLIHAGTAVVNTLLFNTRYLVDDMCIYAGKVFFICLHTQDTGPRWRIVSRLVTIIVSHVVWPYVNYRGGRTDPADFMSWVSRKARRATHMYSVFRVRSSWPFY